MSKARRSTQFSSMIAVASAIALSVLVNVFAARHYKRWDFSTGGLYTLSDATLQTLHALEEPITVHVLLAKSNPLTISVNHLLEAYRSETNRFEIQFVDPDTHPAEFIAIQQKFGISAGETRNGQVIAESAIIVTKNDVPYFITTHDLIEVDDPEDVRARPRIEQTLTRGIRTLLAHTRPTVCFTSGRGETSIEVGGNEGLGELKDRLVKNNYEPIEVATKTVTKPADDISKCSLLFIAGPSEKITPEDVDRYKAHFQSGKSIFAAIGPVPDDSKARLVDLGLAKLLDEFGVEIQSDFVFELDPSVRSTRGFGETFMPSLKAHATTDGLLKMGDRGLPIVLTVANSFKMKDSAIAYSILSTSDKSFGMVDFFAWANQPKDPEIQPNDHRGPLTVGVATEVAKYHAPESTHGARAVIIGSTSPLIGANWRNDELRGTAVFIENAIAWLTEQPAMVDIPAKPTFDVGIRVTDEWLTSTFRYVVLFIPLCSMLIGFSIHLRRRNRRSVKAS